MTEYELYCALRPLYPPREYALLPQVANGTGARAERHADAMALSLWPSRGLHLSGFEIKSYRADWVRELRNPEKADVIAKHCNFWWIVAAHEKIVEDGELPQPWGLLVWDCEKNSLRKAKAAPFREALPIDLPFIAAMLRKAQEVSTPDAAISEAHAKGIAEGEERGKASAKYEHRDFIQLKERVEKFERASGVEIDGWQDAGDIGEAVRLVLNNTVNRERDRLRSIARRILIDLDDHEPLFSGKTKGAGNGSR